MGLLITVAVACAVYAAVASIGWGVSSRRRRRAERHHGYESNRHATTLCKLTDIRILHDSQADELQAQVDEVKKLSQAVARFTRRLIQAQIRVNAQDNTIRVLNEAVCASARRERMLKQGLPMFDDGLEPLLSETA